MTNEPDDITKYDDLYAAIERFCIMTIDAADINTDETAAAYVCRHCRPDIKTSFLQWLNQDKDPAAAAAEIAELYLLKQIALIPCKDKRPVISYKDNPDKLITDRDRLHRWKDGTNGEPCTEYGFIPAMYNLVIIDLDRGSDHANQADGINNFKSVLTRLKLDAANPIFKDFPNNFPCYVKTPSGGLHVYFKCYNKLTGKTDAHKTNAQNIELKYNSKVTTAGSSTAKGKYLLFGTLDDIPEIPLNLLFEFYRAPEPETKPAKWKTGQTWQQFKKKTLYNKTLQEIEKETDQQAGRTSAHNWILVFAGKAARFAYPLQDTINYVFGHEIHIKRKDKADTRHEIQDAYNKYFKG
jgi:hypothetical protein